MSDVWSGAGAGPDETRRRSWGSRGMRVLSGLLLGVLGFALVAQSSGGTAEQSYANLREQDLIDLITGFSADRTRAADDLAAATSERNRLQQQIAIERASVQEADRTTHWASVLDGQVPVSGPGLRITITDPAHQVHPETLLDVVHQLRAADATLMEVNDSVRLTTGSWFGETADGDITVDGQRLQPPYVIDALGPPATLTGALTFARGPLFKVQQLGGTLSWTDSQHVDIKSTRQRVEPRFLQPAETGRGS